MKNILKYLAAFMLFIASVNAESLVNVAGASGIAVGGYDTVAFFTAGAPVHGDPSISAKHEGATYIFSSKENQKKFKANPESYVPQCGGFCAYGVSVNALFPVDINTWQIRNGKLYFNLNPKILKVFNGDFDKNVAKAQKNWPKLVAKNAK